MRKKLGIVRTSCQLLELAIMLTFGAAAQQTPPPQTEGETTEQAFANIKVLRGMPADQLLPTMTLYSTALGVGCPYCHTPPNFSGDEKDPKLTARNDCHDASPQQHLIRWRDRRNLLHVKT